jgi:hypothetical protein
MKPPLPLSEAQRKAALLHRRIAYDRAKPSAADREKHLRELMGLPAAPRQDADRDCEQ